MTEEVSMSTQLRTTLAALACVALLPACVSTTPGYDARLGDAVDIAQARQTFDPGAAARNAQRDVAGLDGRSARAALNEYFKSFSKPEPQANVFTIGVSSASAASR
jgi:hypothetical protein